MRDLTDIETVPSRVMRSQPTTGGGWFGRTIAAARLAPGSGQPLPASRPEHAVRLAMGYT